MTAPARPPAIGVRKPRSADLHPGPGFRILTDFPRLDDEIVSEISEFATPDVSDMLNRLYALDAGITCLAGGERSLCGSACTVRVFPGDNLMVHKSLDIAKPGDVVVIAASGAQSNAVLGDTVAAKALHRRIAGFVVDGFIRDLPGIDRLGLPVYARGTTPIGPLHRGPGEINYPIACGNVVINPGDVVIADRAGVVAIPRQFVRGLLARLRDYRSASTDYLDAVRRGEFDNGWVDELLMRMQCQTTSGISDLPEPRYSVHDQ